MDRPSILIVDDTRTNVELVHGVLSAEGFRTMSAYDGATALALTRAHRPDLILLDVMMPGETGFETCSRLKSDPETADIPIIFLSSLDDVRSKVTGLQVGGVDYVSKPVYGEELLARVRVHLRIRETNRRLVREHKAWLAQLHNAQLGILVRPEDCPQAAFAVHYEPLEEAGGDFYDVIAIDDEVFNYFVADVSGHGAGAAFLTSAIKALLRQYTGPLFSSEDTMRGVDSVMRQVLGEGQYLTACYARLNRRTRKLSVISAGHPPLILVRGDQSVEVLHAESEPLGVFSSVVLQRRDLRVTPEDRFFLYSDGLIEESPGGSRKDGMDRLVNACVRHLATPLGSAVSRIVEEVRSGRNKIEDDLLLMAVEVRP